MLLKKLFSGEVKGEEHPEEMSEALMVIESDSENEKNKALQRVLIISLKEITCPSGARGTQGEAQHSDHPYGRSTGLKRDVESGLLGY